MKLLFCEIYLRLQSLSVQKRKTQNKNGNISDCFEETINTAQRNEMNRKNKLYFILFILLFKKYFGIFA